MAGTWAGTMHTWLEPEGAPYEAPVQGSIQLVLDGRFALYLYQSRLQDEPVHGLLTMGYNTVLERYEASWIDSFHTRTAVMFCTGEQNATGFWVLGSYPDPLGGPDWGWRMELELRDPEHIVLTAFNISPEGVETKAVMTSLARLANQRK